MLAFLLYAVPVVVIAVTLYVGFLGWRFYYDEIIKGADRACRWSSSAGRDRPVVGTQPAPGRTVGHRARRVDRPRGRNTGQRRMGGPRAVASALGARRGAAHARPGAPSAGSVLGHALAIDRAVALALPPPAAARPSSTAGSRLPSTWPPERCAGSPTCRRRESISSTTTTA